LKINRFDWLRGDPGNCNEYLTDVNLPDMSIGSVTTRPGATALRGMPKGAYSIAAARQGVDRRLGSPVGGQSRISYPADACVVDDCAAAGCEKSRNLMAHRVKDSSDIRVEYLRIVRHRSVRPAVRGVLGIRHCWTLNRADQIVPSYADRSRNVCLPCHVGGNEQAICELKPAQYAG
jgi:hypothetical protein